MVKPSDRPSGEMMLVEQFVDSLVSAITPITVEGSSVWMDILEKGSINDIHVQVALWLIGKDATTSTEYSEFARQMRDGVADIKKRYLPRMSETIDQGLRSHNEYVRVWTAAQQLIRLYSLIWTEAPDKQRIVSKISMSTFEDLLLATEERDKHETYSYLMLLFDAPNSGQFREAEQMKENGTEPVVVQADKPVEGTDGNHFANGGVAAAREDEEEQIGIKLPSVFKRVVTPGRTYSPDTIADNLVRIYLNPFCAARKMTTADRGTFIERQVEASFEQVMALVRNEDILRAHEAKQEWNNLIALLNVRVMDEAGKKDKTGVLSRLPYFKERPPPDTDTVLKNSCNPAPKAPQTTELYQQLMKLYNSYHPTTGGKVKRELKLEKTRESINKDLHTIARRIVQKMGKENGAFFSAWIAFKLSFDDAALNL